MKKQQSIMHTLLANVVFIVSIFAGQNLHAAPLSLYATNVVNYSSQWSGGNWSAAQALGASNTFSYGDIATAWAAFPRNGSLEFITVGFDRAIYATGTTIRETYGNGFVTKIDLLDLNSTFHTVWEGIDPSQPGAPVDFLVTWAQTNYLTNGIRIWVDTNHDQNAWEEIDSIQLHGVSEIPVPAAVWLFSSAMVCMGGFGKRKQNSKI